MNRGKLISKCLAAGVVLTSLVFSIPCFSQTTTADEQLADQVSKDLDNPISDLINLPIQFNWERGGGIDDKGEHYYMKMQPVIPMQVYGNWHIISRSIFSVENKQHYGYGNPIGLSDLTQTFFIAPIDHRTSFKWGIGPAFLIPTATERQYGSEKWGAGPSFVLIGEVGNFTFGILTRHIWSFAGNANRNYVDESVVQPYLSYHFTDAWSLKLDLDYKYDWHDNEQQVPFDLTLSKVINFGDTPISFSFGGRYYVDRPSHGADWGLRAGVTIAFPRYIKDYIERKIIHYEN